MSELPSYPLDFGIKFIEWKLEERDRERKLESEFNEKNLIIESVDYGLNHEVDLLSEIIDNILPYGTEYDRRAIGRSLSKLESEARGGSVSSILHLSLIYIYACSRNKDKKWMKTVYPVAVRWVQSVALPVEETLESEDADFLYVLGILYEHLFEYLECEDMGDKFLERSFSLGKSEALLALQTARYEPGVDGRNFDEALEYLERAHEAGNESAVNRMAGLGVLEIEGLATKKPNRELGKKWLEAAAKYGSKMASNMLASLNGDESSESAGCWLSLEKEKTEERVRNFLCRMLGEGHPHLSVIDSEMSPEDLENCVINAGIEDVQALEALAKMAEQRDDWKEALAWWAALGRFDKNAFCSLVEYMDNSMEGLCSYEYVEKLFTILKKAGLDMDTVLRLGKVCEREGNICIEKGGNDNVTEGIAWLKLAVLHEDADAAYDLALLYKRGKKVPANKKEVKFWESETARLNLINAERGNPYAQRDLACLYERGCGVPQSNKKAHRWYKEAADTFRTYANNGDIQAKFELADMIAAEVGTPFEPEEAEKLYREALENDIPEAQSHYVHFCMKMIGTISRKGGKSKVKANELTKWLQRLSDVDEQMASAAMRGLGLV